MNLADNPRAAVERRFKLPVIGTQLSILAINIYWVWPDWRIIVELLAVTAAMIVSIRAVEKIMHPDHRRFVLVPVNVFLFNLLAHVGNWQLPFLLYLCFALFVFDGFLASRERCFLVVPVMVSALWAALDGVPVPVVVALVGTQVGILVVTGGRTWSLTEAFEQIAKSHAKLTQAHKELARAHEQLAQTHARLEQVHAQALAQEKMSSLGVMAAGIAHEINNPMAYVTSNLHELIEEIDAHPECRMALSEYVEEVLPATLDGVRRVNTIVADLRRFARQDPETTTEFALNDQIQAALRILHGKIRDTCHTEVDLGMLSPMVGRPQQLMQVVINLVLNAAQAAPGGTVRVSTREHAGQILLTVTDDGAGMSPEVVAHLFQPFFTTKPVGQGTGLGLAVVQGIVTAHGGTIEVESPPGGGTTFIIQLPAMPSDTPSGLWPMTPERARLPRGSGSPASQSQSGATR